MECKHEQDVCAFEGREKFNLQMNGKTIHQWKIVLNFWAHETLFWQVDEGIEAMLCCWLQQLQEFGGPEVDKPDLLKGSIGSLKNLGLPNTKAGSGTGSLARHNTMVDLRARYNVSVSSDNGDCKCVLSAVITPYKVGWP